MNAHHWFGRWFGSNARAARRTPRRRTQRTILQAEVLESRCVPTLFTSLGSFTGSGSTGNGSNPTGVLVEDASGNLYGTAQAGGAFNYGTVFEAPYNGGTYGPITALASFNGGNGIMPLGGLVEDASGNLYGVTATGGIATHPSGGTVFEVAAHTNTITTLALFNGTNGQDPVCSPIADANGNLYGTTVSGGTFNDGTVFELPKGASTIITIVSFNGLDGANPYGGVIMDASGNLYGTTSLGGPNNDGTVFEVPAGTNIINTLAAFNGSGNGSNPTQYARPMLDSQGNLWGTASLGGANSNGTLWELPSGSSTITVYPFSSNTNGANPEAGVVEDVNTDVFGTCTTGGTGLGTVFELGTGGTGSFTSLVNFTGTSGAAPGSAPLSTLLQDSMGDLFGSTTTGGSANDGTIFELIPSCSPIVTVLPQGTSGQPSYNAMLSATDVIGTATFSLTPSAGNALPPGLTLSGSGVISGMPTTTGTFNFSVTVTDSASNSGSGMFTIVINPAVTITTTALPNWTVNVPGYSQQIFATGGTGTLTFATAGPLPSGLALSNSGLLAGTPTSAGTYTFTVTATDTVGASASQTYTITINPPVSIGVTTLATFNGANGSLPLGDLLKIGTNIFGTTNGGGSSTSGPSSGTVFELNESTGMLTTLVTLTGTNGAEPGGGLVADAMGDLFGTTTDGGASGAGTFFELSRNISTGIWTYNYTSFNGTTLGGNPFGDLIMDSNGNFFGTTSSGGSSGLGTIFEVQPIPAGSWTITTLASFDGPHGAVPLAGLIMGPNRTLYGTTSMGGTSGDGTVFMVPFTTAGTYGPITTLASFDGTNGSDPQAPLTMDSGGNLYGTTVTGGADELGTVFELANGSGAIDLCSSFDNTNGALPLGGLTMDNEGHLFGTTAYGGPSGLGTVFLTVRKAGMTTLATFNGPSGANPVAGIIDRCNGNLFGTTEYGGPSDDGTVFKVINTLPGASMGMPYSQALMASGGTGPLTFLSSPGLPPGLVLNTDGTLSGTPTVPGTYSFDVKVTDGLGAWDSHLYTVVVFGPPVIAPTLLPNWTENLAYSQQVSATGGDAPYSFAVSSGSLPTGLSLNGSAGLISGTPISVGTFTFTIKVTDSLGASASQSYIVMINQPITIGAGYPPGTVGHSYNYALAPAVSGGTGAYTFTATGILPPGLNLGSSGTLAGIPTLAGTYTFMLTVTDSVGATGTVPMPVTIFPALMITTTNLPGGDVGCPYNQTIQTTGGSAPITFALTNGALPPGLMINSSGVVSGTPTAVGSFTFTVTASDTNGATSTQIYTVVINPMVSITTTTLSNWTVNVPGYSQSIATTGGTAPIAFSKSAGALPTGLNLNPSTGIISGTPTATGTYMFTITAGDSAGCSASQGYTVIIYPALVVPPLTLPGAMAGVFYEQVLSATGGTPPLTFSIPPAGPMLPTGMFLTPGGTLLGVPTVVGTFPISVSVVDGIGATANQNYVVTIGPGKAVAVKFITQPTNTPTGDTLPPESVQIVDAYNDPVTTDSVDNVGISAVGPGGFTAGSTTTIMLHNGAANFSNLTLVVPGTYTLQAQVKALGLIGSSNAFSVLPLQVVSGSFAGSPSGFSLQFNAPYLVNSLTPVLYGQGFGNTAPVPSVTLTQTADAGGNPVNNPVLGSLVLNTATNSITFVTTDTSLEADKGSPVLPDGTYTVVVHSKAATDGFQAFNNGGGFLDGLGNGVPGSGDYTNTFVVNVAASHEDVVWVPATADGPGEPLNAPGNNRVGGGYPIYLSDKTGMVSSVQATLTYNPALLTVTLTSTSTFTVMVPSPGTAVLQYSGPALPAGSETPIGFITAMVPSGTANNPIPYKMKDLLHLSGVSLNGGAVAVATSDALHLVAYVADADGNGAYSSNDAVLITRALLSTDSGFTAYPLVDPVIVADVRGDGFIPSDAALQANEASVGLPAANLPTPPIPPGVIFTPIGNNVDPSLSLTVGARQTGAVTVAVNLDDAHPAGSTGLIRAELALTYDPHQFTVSAADVHLGSLLAAAGGWTVVTNIDQGTGQIAIALSSTTAISTTSPGSLVTIDFHPVGPISNPSSIELVAAASPNGHFVATELEDMQGAFTLTPPASKGPGPLHSKVLDPFLPKSTNDVLDRVFADELLSLLATGDGLDTLDVGHSHSILDWQRVGVDI